MGTVSIIGTVGTVSIIGTVGIVSIVGTECDPESHVFVFGTDV